MKPSFKVVNVYTGYAEYGVENVDTIHADNIYEACVQVEENNHEALRKDNEDEFDNITDAYIKEFYTGFRKLSTLIYMVNYGEENVQLVIHESRPLYQLVDRPTSEWTDQQWADWVALFETV